MAEPAWLDGLSEEWVPVPQPPPASSPTLAPTKKEVSTTPNSVSQSRIPRMRPPSASFSEVQLRHDAPRLHASKRKSAAAERSVSDTNLSTPPSADASQVVRSHRASQSFSALSLDSSSMYNGTVAQKVLPKETAPNGTPEWRRRLLKGDLGYGDQKDLFAPSGLENIFQKPSGASAQPKQPKRKLGMLKGLGAIPSSPPPWPSSDARDAGHTLDRQAQAQDAEGAAQQDPSQVHSCLSAVSAPSHSADGPRAISGQTEFENENFSPVFLSMHMKKDPTPAPTPDFRGSELAHRLRNIATPPQNRSHGPIPDPNSVQTRGDSSYTRLQDDSLPEDLPAGTPDLADVGRFVEMKRGGYSREGSFRTRPLSPSPRREKQQSALRIETTSPPEDREHGHTTEQGNTPRTPPRPGYLMVNSEERPKSSGSPLKLFDAHDTFTSNRLQRRLSQLENRSEKTASSSIQTTRSEVTKMVQKISRLTSVEEVSIQQGVAPDGVKNAGQERQRAGTFGQGQLNAYRFSADFSVLSDDSEDDSAPDESPSINAAPPGSRQPLQFHYSESPTSREPSRLKRSGLTRVSNPFRALSQTSQTGPRASRAPAKMQREEVDCYTEYAEGKRGPTSPFKVSTPKRQRTLQKADDDVLNDSGVLDAIQAAIVRKRKDARNDQSHNVADADVLAQRHVLRPRNPTPNQRRLEEIHAEIIEATEAFIHSSPEINVIRDQIGPDESDAFSEEARAAIVANEVAAFTMKRQQMRDAGRKKSVTTQDFLDEARQIMNFIRTKGRPTSGLGSLEESGGESPFAQDQNTDPSISLTFDKPPSREGQRSAWKEPNKHELDPEVMSHLRKYREGESDDMLGSSFRSLRFSQMKRHPNTEDNSIIVEQNDIRIIDNPDRLKQPIDADPSNTPPRTNGTHPSTSSSMGQTIVTNTSRRSEHVATLAPEAVAHLIPSEIAGMSYDPQTKSWVRQKSPSREHRPIPEEISAVNESEDDPFGEIPDLTVDETAERLMDKVSPARQQATAETVLEDTTDEKLHEKARPVTREGKEMEFADSSSSKASNFAWSYPKTETRATSYSDHDSRKGGTQKLQHVPTTDAIPESEEDDVEHEIKYFEGRGVANAETRRVRDITISIAERDFGGLGERAQHLNSPSKKLPPHRWTDGHILPPRSSKKTVWGRSHGAHTLTNGRNVRRPIFTEEGDVSILEDLPNKGYRMQVSMSVSAPPALKHQDGLPSSPVKPDVTFMLSDLPEFTLNQVDECELPNRVVVKHDGHRFSRALEDRYALGTAELVKALQDVEPDEPYWEDLREVNLHNKGLTSLNRLDEFCYRLEELDVSKNNLDQVKGIPYTMRRLQAQNNCLTALTTWTTLMNLQYLDISGNDIDTLDGLGELIHLRTLKADDSRIRSLNGVLHLDGLIELSVAGNEIETVDFAAANLKSMTDLNLRGNRLYEVRNIHRLPQLQHLNLDDNHIDEFPLIDTPSNPSKALRSLRLCGNDMSLLNVDDHFPRLESLYVDRNALTNISGLEHLRYLRTFSAREQMLETRSDLETCVGNLVKNSEVRSLYLSLNPTRAMEFSQHLLNLQRLELSSMGLRELPSDFGQLTPNIRSINLNFNALRDLRPLLNIKRLNELLVAGNKLDRLRANAMVVGKLKTLSKLDWRDNPITMRFYAPACEKRVMSLRHNPSDEQATNHFILPNADIEADQQYLTRLDAETRIRRRVTEMMLANLCVHLRELDGLTFDKTRILVKDDVWKRLLELGVIQRKQPDSLGDITG
ncbi:hypothetical protein P280DRAFT_471798 [Massarina eburnea CBS 473.64]|uniref:L domain-like protein n=1 Tax=Massarina eburnea CBS 473.64 TaxID=1395130 RepID=A0A6A6RSF6_9PLEO|nr:hypothetical protein P280DRAFT_471798 [Massarina eburnea CBS 473.64]